MPARRQYSSANGAILQFTSELPRKGIKLKKICLDLERSINMIDYLEKVPDALLLLNALACYSNIAQQSQGAIIEGMKKVSSDQGRRHTPEHYQAARWPILSTGHALAETHDSL